MNRAINDLKKYNRDECFNLLQITTAALRICLRAKSAKNDKFWLMVRVREQLIAEIYGKRFEQCQD